MPRTSIKNKSLKRKRSFKGKYAAYRKGLSLPRTTSWSIGRDQRPFVLNAINCWEAANGVNVTAVVQTNVSANYVFAPRLTDFSSASDFIATYDAYKVLSVELSFYPTMHPSYITNTANLITNEWVKTAIDINDATQFTALLYEQTGSFRAHQMDQPITRKWQPAFLNTNALGVNLLQDQKDSWISVSASGSSVPQLSCKLFMPPYPAAVGSAGAITFIIKCRMVVIGRSQG